MKGIKRWVILAGLFLVSFLENGTQRSFAIILSDLSAEFNVSTAFLGALFGFVFGASYILAFSTIPLLRRFSVRQLTIVGGLLSCVGLVLSSLADTASQFSAAMSVFGLGYILIVSPTNSCPVSYFPDHFAMANGIMLSGGSTGVMLLPLLFEFLVNSYGWRGAVMLLGGINAYIVVSGALLQRLTRAVEVEDDDQTPPRNVCSSHCSAMNPGFDTSEDGEDNENLQSRDRMQDVSTSLPDSVDSDKIECQGEIDNELTPVGEDSATLNCSSRKDGSSTAGQKLQKSPVPDETASKTDSSSTSSKANKGSMELNEEVSVHATIPEPSSYPEHRNVSDNVQKRKRLIRVFQALIRFFELNIFQDHPFLIIVCIQAVFFGMSYSGWLLFVIPNAIAKGLSTSRAVQISVVGGVCNFLGRLGIGALASKDFLSVEVLYCIINIISAAAFFTNFIAESFWLLMVLSVIYGLMQGLKSPSQQLLIMNAVGKDCYSTGLPLLYFCIGLSFPISGALFGAIFDTTGSYNFAFCAVGLFDILVAIITIAPQLRTFCRRIFPPRSVQQEVQQG